MERSVEKDILVRVCGTGGDKIKRRVACADDGDSALDYLCAIDVCEIVLFAKRLEGGLDIRPQCFARGLEVEKEDEGLCGDGVENAGRTALSDSWIERGFWILAREDIEEGIDVEAVKGAVGGEARDVVTDVQFLFI